MVGRLFGWALYVYLSSIYLSISLSHLSTLLLTLVVVIIRRSVVGYVTWGFVVWRGVVWRGEGAGWRVEVLACLDGWLGGWVGYVLGLGWVERRKGGKSNFGEVGIGYLEMWTSFSSASR